MSPSEGSPSADSDHPGGHSEKPIGRVMSRREALQLFTASPFLLGVAGCTSDDASADEPITGSCVARPELTEGPFYVDTDLLRTDIREDRKGTRLELSLSVSRVEGYSCVPLEDAVVDVWQADANGNYSGVGANEGETFLRGIQKTDEEGKASFTTIYPGWYPGCTPHIHYKVRTPAEGSSAYEFTSQLFFEDTLSREIYTSVPPYAERGIHDTANSDDWIYRNGGPKTLLAVSEAEDGLKASFDIALKAG